MCVLIVNMCAVWNDDQSEEGGARVFDGRVRGKEGVVVFHLPRHSGWSPALWYHQFPGKWSVIEAVWGGGIFIYLFFISARITEASVFSRYY